MSVAREVLEAGKRNAVMIATAESCTGGMVSAALTDIAGSSAVVECGFVTYSNAAKIQMLGVKPETLSAYGAVSEEVAVEMAQGAVTSSGATLAVSITGIAGPGGSEHKPEGRVCFATSFKGEVQVETVEFGPRGRHEVRQAACAHALKLLLERLS